MRERPGGGVERDDGAVREGVRRRAGDEEKDTLRGVRRVRHSSEEDESSDSSDDDASGDDDAGGDGAPMSARAFAAFGGSSIKPRARESPGKELRATPLGWRLATELLRACASVDDVRATADVFDVLRASFTASAGDASAWSAQSPLSPQSQSPGSGRVKVLHPRRRQSAWTSRRTAPAPRRGPRRLSWPPRGLRRGVGPEVPRRRLRAPFEKLTDVDPNEGIDVRHDAPRPVTWERGRATLERLAGEAASRLREIAARAGRERRRRGRRARVVESM